MKNVRKLQGSLILVAQNLSDLVINGDTSLISQTELRVFFTKDPGNQNFDKISGLSENSLITLDQIRTVNGRYSQFILKDAYGEKVIRLSLSKEEYLRSSTHPVDREKIEKIDKKCD